MALELVELLAPSGIRRACDLWTRFRLEAGVSSRANMGVSELLKLYVDVMDENEMSTRSVAKQNLHASGRERRGVENHG